MLVCAALFSFVMMYTYSFIGFCGLAFALIAAVAAVFALKAPKKKLISIPVSIAAAAGAIALVFAGAIGSIDSYRLYDGRILWWADGYMRAAASGNFDSRVIDIDDTYDVYSYMNSRAMDVIENNALTGTGPDQLAFALIRVTKEDAGKYSDISDLISSQLGVFAGAPLPVFAALRSARTPPDRISDQQKETEGERADEHAHRVEGEGGDLVRAFALGGEGGALDHGGQQKQKSAHKGAFIPGDVVVHVV